MVGSVERFSQVRPVGDGGELPPLARRPGSSSTSPRILAIGKQEASETACASGLQILFPFLFAGLGMVAAGLLLDRVMQRAAFRDVRELCILVPPLLGLKGNLEMTLASRLSSHAALGDFDTRASGMRLVVANLCLIQCQGLVLGFVASCVAALMSQTAGDGLSYDDFMLLCSSAMLTASMASLLIGLLMAVVVIGARRCGCNPDNIAAPIAAALGDLLTLALLSKAAEAFWRQRGTGLCSFVVFCYFVVAMLCALRVRRCPHTAPVLHSGWGPIICSLCISSLGGMVLDRASESFPKMPAFQPVINGAGGNLAAVQASRMATHLHSVSRPGELKEDADTQRGLLPWSVFFGSGRHKPTARVLICLVVPGHLLFLWVTIVGKGYEDCLCAKFLGLYMLGALVQEWFLLYACMHMVHAQWRWGIDPDNSAVPFLTAMGDLVGSSLLAGTFAATSAPEPPPRKSTLPPTPTQHRRLHPAQGKAFALLGSSRHVGSRPVPMLAVRDTFDPPLQSIAVAFVAVRALFMPARSSARQRLRRC